jgi:hypothetical protein
VPKSLRHSSRLGHLLRCRRRAHDSTRLLLPQLAQCDNPLHQSEPDRNERSLTRVPCGACVKQIGPMFAWTEEVAPRAGCEPATHWLTSRCRSAAMRIPKNQAPWRVSRRRPREVADTHPTSSEAPTKSLGEHRPRSKLMVDRIAATSTKCEHAPIGYRAYAAARGSSLLTRA